MVSKNKSVLVLVIVDYELRGYYLHACVVLNVYSGDLKKQNGQFIILLVVALIEILIFQFIIVSRVSLLAF